MQGLDIDDVIDMRGRNILDDFCQDKAHVDDVWGEISINFARLLCYVIVATTYYSSLANYTKRPAPRNSLPCPSCAKRGGHLSHWAVDKFNKQRRRHAVTKI